VSLTTHVDLLVFLVERRHEAVHQQEIFDRVRSDVIACLEVRPKRASLMAC